MGCILRRIPLHFSWFILFFVWVAYQLQPHQFSNNSLIHSYLDDLVVIPIVLGGILVIFRNLVFKSTVYTFPKARIWIVVAIFAAYFELIIPRFNTGFTADIFDVLCYAIGGLYFQFLINKPFAVQQASCKV